MNIKTSVAVACFLPGRAKDLSAPLYSSGLLHGKHKEKATFTIHNGMAIKERRVKRAGAKTGSL
jgi:hypothetical protein